MSHFLREFEAILAENKITSGSQIFETAGFARSMLSRIRAGGNIQFEEIPRVAAAIGPEAMIFLRLHRARLLDECTTDDRAARINIEITATKYAGGPMPGALRDVPLQPAHWEKALTNIIRAMPEDAGLRDTILWLGNEVFAPDDASSESPRLKAAKDAAVEVAEEVFGKGRRTKHKK